MDSGDHGETSRPKTSHLLKLKTQYEAPRAFDSPTGRTLLLHYPAGGRKDFPSLSNSPANERPSNSANEKPGHLKLSVSANGLFIY